MNHYNPNANHYNHHNYYNNHMNYKPTPSVISYTLKGLALPFDVKEILINKYNLEEIHLLILETILSKQKTTMILIDGELYYFLTNGIVEKVNDTNEDLLDKRMLCAKGYEERIIPTPAAAQARSPFSSSVHSNYGWSGMQHNSFNYKNNFSSDTNMFEDSNVRSNTYRPHQNNIFDSDKSDDITEWSNTIDWTTLGN
jgi:hypothetical protein